MWDASSGALLASLDSQRGKLARFTPDGSGLVAGRGDVRVQIWSRVAGPQLAAFSPPADATIVAVSSDGARVATESRDGWITLGDTTTLRRLEHVAIHAPVAIGRTQLAASTATGAVLLDLETGATRAELRLPARATALHVADTVARLAVMTAAGAEIWDASRGEKLLALDGADHALLSADGTRALGWSADGRARVWDVDARQHRAELAPPARYQPLGFANGATRVVLVEDPSGTTRTVSLWNADTGERIAARDDTSG